MTQCRGNAGGRSRQVGARQRRESGPLHCRGPGISQQASFALGLYRQPHILQHRHVPHDIGPLERPADARPSPLPGGPAGDVLIVQRNLASRQRQFTGQQVHQRALARAVRADHGMQLARLQGEGHLIDRQQATEPPGQAGGTQCSSLCLAGRAIRVRDRRRGLGPAGRSRRRGGQSFGEKTHARQSLPQEQDRGQENHPFDQFRTIGDQRSRLLHRGQGERPNDRAMQGADAAQQDHQQCLGRPMPAQQVGADEAVGQCRHMTGQAGQRPRQHETDQLDALNVMPHRRHAVFVGTDTLQRMPQHRSHHGAQPAIDRDDDP